MYVSRKMEPFDATELCQANGVMNSQTSRSVNSSQLEEEPVEDKCDVVVDQADDKPGGALLPGDDVDAVSGSNETETSVEAVVLNVTVLNVESRAWRPPALFLVVVVGEGGAAASVVALEDWNIFGRSFVGCLETIK